MDSTDLLEDDGTRRAFAIERLKILYRRYRDLFTDLDAHAQLLEGLAIIPDAENTPVRDIAIEMEEWFVEMEKRLRKR